MSNTVVHLLNVLTSSAFQASLGGDVLYMNEPMRNLFGAKADTNRSRTVFGLGLFDNHAEFRGFLRGFQTVGPLQRIHLPSTRLKTPSRRVVLNAVLHESNGERSIIGVLSIDEPVELSLGSDPTNDTPNVSNLPYFVFVTDAEGRFSYANAAMRAFLQLEKGDDLGAASLRTIDVDYTPATWQNALLLARKNGDHTYQTNLRRPNGTVLPVELTIVRVEGFPVKRVLVAAHSVSQQRKLEAEVRDNHLELEDLRRIRERDRLHQQQEKNPSPREVAPAIISQSTAYQPILRQVARVAPTDSTVLITGETGTGKELLAKAIHQASRRANEPLVIVNCGALPKDLIESELFGYKKGAFTGATRDRVGRFKLADEGTLFLDEVGEMPLDLQTRLLRFLQEGEFTPIGGQETIYANVRIIAATNRDLTAMVQEGTFRSDLYYRLNVFPIHNLPLRQRKDDIPPLLDHFIQKHRRRINSQVTTYGPEVVEKLRAYSFPGNVRELENIVERALIMSNGEELTLDWDIANLLPEVVEKTLTMPTSQEADRGEAAGAMVVGGNGAEGEVLPLDEMISWYISRVLELTEGRVSGKGGAAEKLDVNPQTLFSKIRKLGVKR